MKFTPVIFLITLLISCVANAQTSSNFKTVYVKNYLPYALEVAMQPPCKGGVFIAQNLKVNSTHGHFNFTAPTSTCDINMRLSSGGSWYKLSSFSGVNVSTNIQPPHHPARTPLFGATVEAKVGPKNGKIEIILNYQ